jgi:hypothetical protein
LGVAVVVLTAATGTAVITALATSTNQTAKIVVGVLSVASAVAAGLNTKGPFTGQVRLHAEKASEFNKINRNVGTLHREWARAKIADDDVDAQLKILETSYDGLKNKTPGVRHYVASRDWANEHLPPDELLELNR